MIKTASATGTTARIYVPKLWTGKRVAMILLDPPDDPSFPLTDSNTSS
jgi:hypothetical protein